MVGRDVTVQEVLEEVMSDQPYYRRSGGGVTLSGGEALVQPGFCDGAAGRLPVAGDYHGGRDHRLCTI